MAEGGLDITTCLEAISRRLVDAAAVAQAAVTCARSGSEREAVRIAMDLDLLLNESQTLHGAVCLIGRMERAEAAIPLADPRPRRRGLLRQPCTAPWPMRGRGGEGAIVLPITAEGDHPCATTTQTRPAPLTDAQREVLSAAAARARRRRDPAGAPQGQSRPDACPGAARHEARPGDPRQGRAAGLAQGRGHGPELHPGADQDWPGAGDTAARRGDMQSRGRTVSTCRLSRSRPRSALPRAGSKLPQVIALLGREQGSSVAELMAATGWLPHTTRAALTGLRKRGYALTREAGEGGSVYRIAPAPAARGLSRDGPQPARGSAGLALGPTSPESRRRSPGSKRSICRASGGVPQPHGADRAGPHVPAPAASRCWPIASRPSPSAISARDAPPARPDHGCLQASGSSRGARHRRCGSRAPVRDVPKRGTVLVREWQGRMEHVMVLADGFAWNGSSLSEPLGRGARPSPAPSGTAAASSASIVPEAVNGRQELVTSARQAASGDALHVSGATRAAARADDPRGSAMHDGSARSRQPASAKAMP